MRKAAAVIVSIMIAVLPMTASATPIAAAELMDEISIALPDGYSISAGTGTPYKAGIEKYQYYELANINSGMGSITYYMNVEGPGEEIDRTDRKSVLEAYEKEYEDLQEAFDTRYNGCCSMGDASTLDMLKSENGEIQLKHMEDLEEEWSVFYLTPMYDGCWRCIQFYASKDGTDVFDEAALSFSESDKAVYSMIKGMLERTGKEGSGSMSFGKWFAMAILAVILVSIAWFNRAAIRRNRRQVEEARRTGRPKEDDTAGKKKIMLTCVNCQKRFIVYVEPRFEAMTRKNTTRCPECRKELDKTLDYIDRHTIY